jgi:DNA repair protein RadC
VLAHRVRCGASVQSPKKAGEHLTVRLGHLDYEVFGLILLDKRHRVIECVDLFRGTIDGASVHPREIVKIALQKSAAACIVYHNHPSGVQEPSQADELITARVKEALALIDVRLIDHCLGGFCSVTTAVKIHQSPGFSRYQSRTKYSIDGWLHLWADLTSNFALARSAPRESGLAERLVARVQLRRSVMLFS